METKSVYPKEAVYIEEATISDIVSYIVERHDDIELIGSIKEQVMKMITGKRKKGIFIKKEDDGIQIDIYIMLNEISSYFSRCILLQEEIKQEVEWMTGLNVKTVNIHIVRVLVNKVS